MGEDDHILTIKKPKDNPEWMDEDELKKIPSELKIREMSSLELTAYQPNW